MANDASQPNTGSAGAAEIASVGIGVHANIVGLQTGMAQVQYIVNQTAAQVRVDATNIETTIEQSSAKAAAAAARTAQSVKVSAADAASAVQQSVANAGHAASAAVGTTSSFAKQLNRAKKAATGIFNSMFVVPGVAVAAYALGKQIGERLFHGIKEKMRDEQVGLVVQAKQQIAEAQSALVQEIAKAQKEAGQPPIDSNILKSAQSELKTLDEEIVRIRNGVEMMRGAYARLRAQQDTLTEGTDDHQSVVELTQKTWDDILAAQKRYDELAQRRVATEERYNTILGRGKNLLTDQAEIVERRAAEERRANAQREVAAERMSIDISRMRSLMELSVRQKYPVAPGAQVIRGGEGNLVR